MCADQIVLEVGRVIAVDVTLHVGVRDTIGASHEKVLQLALAAELSGTAQALRGNTVSTRTMNACSSFI